MKILHSIIPKLFFKKPKPFEVVKKSNTEGIFDLNYINDFLEKHPQATYVSLIKFKDENLRKYYNNRLILSDKPLNKNFLKQSFILETLEENNMVWNAYHSKQIPKIKVNIFGVFAKSGMFYRGYRTTFLFTSFSKQEFHILSHKNSKKFSKKNTQTNPMSSPDSYWILGGTPG